MSLREYEGWIDYFNRHPFDDLHRYHRPALGDTLIRGGVAFDRVIEWMRDDMTTKANEPTAEDADANTLRALGLSRPKGK